MHLVQIDYMILTLAHSIVNFRMEYTLLGSCYNGKYECLLPPILLSRF